MKHFYKLQEEFHRHIKDLYEQLRAKIKNSEFLNASLIISALDIPNNEVCKYYFDQTEKLIHREIDKLIEDTITHVKMIGNSLDLEIIKMIKNNFKRLKEINKNIAESLKTLQCFGLNHQQELSQIEDELKKKLLEFLKRLEGQKNNNNFLEICKRIEHLQIVVNILGDNCPQEIRKTIDTMQTQEKLIENAFQKYVPLKFEDYYKYPPKEIFERFTEAGQINSVYFEYLIRLKEEILKKFRKEFNEIRFEQDYKKCKNTLSFLPKNIKELLDLELMDYKNQFVQLRRGNSRR